MKQKLKSLKGKKIYRGVAFIMMDLMISIMTTFFKAMKF